MKAKLFTTFILGMTLLFQVSCGKKSNSSSGGKEQENYTDNDLIPIPYQQLEEIVAANDLNSLRRFIRDYPKLNPNRATRDDDTLLCLAIRRNYRKMVEILIDRGADIEMITHLPDTFEMAPLMVAASQGHLHLVKLLVSKGAEIDRKSGLAGRTALHQAIARKFDDLAIYLIQNGASLDAVDNEKRNAYQLAMISGSEPIIEYIRGIKYIKDGTAPDAATFRNLIIQGDSVYLSKVLSRYPDVVKSYETINPLVLAIENADEGLAFSMVQLLITYQFDSNGPKDALTTPLIKAVKTNRSFIAEYLIQKKANVNALDGTGKSPLYYAIDLNLPDMVKLLLAQNAQKRYEYQFKNSYDFLYFNACQLAYEASRKYTTGQEKIDNQTIRLNLGSCKR